MEQTPDGFTFALKASRYLTHIKRLTDMREGVRRYYERIEPLVRSPKLGPIVWQLPPNFRRDDARLAGALEALPPGRHCFEFRHETWFVPEVYAMLRAAGVALVIGDRKGLNFASTTACAGAAATTRRPRSRSGRGESPPGARGPRCTRTSTTTGRSSPRATRWRWGGS
ncbi:MAG TPA: DUF72 domain-containing protein [Solirubrobacteraceae bacterium]|nr:DUF72 domain-containing protein [Solirubrobacteraceae bacterium]